MALRNSVAKVLRSRERLALAAAEAVGGEQGGGPGVAPVDAGTLAPGDEQLMLDEEEEAR
jgi:hypothetical protein